MSAMEQASRDPETDYLDHFGLSEDPFTVQHWPLFEGGQRREILAELLRHCQLSTTVLAVLGEAGVGKSCFRHALCKRLESGDSLCVVDIPLLVDAERVLSYIARQFGVPGATAPRASGSAWEASTRVAAIRDCLEQFAGGDRLSVLVVEDAHNLDDTALGLLLELSACREGGYGSVRLVLFGEPALGPRLAGLEAKGRFLKTFLIEPLSPADLKSYLRCRLEAASFAGIFPFRREDMQYLWELSRGVPAAVHEPARAILRDLALPPPEPESLGLPLGHSVAITALVAGLLIALFYSGGESTGLSGAPGSAPEQTPIGVNPDPESAPIQMLGWEPRKPQGRKSATAADSLLPDTGNASRAIAQQQKQAGHDNISPPEVAQPPAEVATLADVSSDTESPSPTADAVSVPSRDRALPQGESTLLARSPERFTLQISAAGSRASVDQFVRAQPNRDELLVFAARRAGKVLHIVVAGDFASAREARSAIPSLPKDQQEAGPWARPLHAVQGDIRRYRGL